MNIAEEFAQHLVDLTRNDAQSGEISAAIVRFFLCRTHYGIGSYPPGPLLAQLEEELLRIAAQLHAHRYSGYGLIDADGQAPDRIARKIADLRWTIREEEKRLELSPFGQGALRNTFADNAWLGSAKQPWTEKPSQGRRRAIPLAEQRAARGALLIFLAGLISQVALIAWTATHLVQR